MTILEYTRNRIFWLLDSLRGGYVKKSLQNLRDIEENNIYDEKELKQYYEPIIQDLLLHCVNTVPIYENLHNLLKEENPLEKWPIVNKNMLKEDFESHLSRSYNKRNLIPMSTSGSTGTPFTCWQDSGKKRHVNAEVLFYSGKLGYRIGDRLIFFRSVVKEVAKSHIKQYLQNIYLLDCKDLSDEKISDKLNKIKELSTKSGVFILSYASTLEAFRKYIDKYGDDIIKGCNVQGIISGSEMLHDKTREDISKAFGCKVVSRYSNEENGIIGQDDEEYNVFLHNRANYYIEILKLDSNEQAEVGEIGRIVITDLFNRSMPLVRYDTGDVGAWQEIIVNGKRRKAIGKFGGRKTDLIYNCYGEPLSPHAITNTMWDYPEIKQFQFIQLDVCKYQLRINTEVPVDNKKIIETLKKIIGKNASIEIEFCNEIPILSSGKRRYIVNTMPTKEK